MSNDNEENALPSVKIRGSHYFLGGHTENCVLTEDFKLLRLNPNIGTVTHHSRKLPVRSKRARRKSA